MTVRELIQKLQSLSDLQEASVYYPDIVGQALITGVRRGVSDSDDNTIIVLIEVEDIG